MPKPGTANTRGKGSSGVLMPPTARIVPLEIGAVVGDEVCDRGCGRSGQPARSRASAGGQDERRALDADHLLGRRDPAPAVVGAVLGHRRSAGCAGSPRWSSSQRGGCPRRAARPSEARAGPAGSRRPAAGSAGSATGVSAGVSRALSAIWRSASVTISIIRS